MQANDLKFASKMCVQLMDKNEPLVWPLCVELGINNDIIEVDLKIKFLSFAVLNCPVEKIVSIIELRYFNTYLDYILRTYFFFFIFLHLYLNKLLKLFFKHNEFNILFF